ncbi:MAG: hypothetical protein HQK91_12610 [Nitrospirae bacterium]|nr:hypothetical protein [Nitrospirota bacterium]
MKKIIVILLLIVLSSLMFSTNDLYADSGNNGMGGNTWMYFGISMVVVMAVMMIVTPKLIFGEQSNDKMTAIDTNINIDFTALKDMEDGKINDILSYPQISVE